jgi:hypothetical protein
LGLSPRLYSLIKVVLKTTFFGSTFLEKSDFF